MKDTDKGYVWCIEDNGVGVYIPYEYHSVQLTQQDLEEMLEELKKSKEDV